MKYAPTWKNRHSISQDQTIASKFVELSLIMIKKIAVAKIKCIQQMFRVKNSNIKCCAG